MNNQRLFVFHLFKHPNEIANMSLALLQCKQQVRVPRTSAQLQLRIGIHTGNHLDNKSTSSSNFNQILTIEKHSELFVIPGAYQIATSLSKHHVIIDYSQFNVVRTSYYLQ